MRVSALEIYTKMVEEGCIAESSLLEMWIFFFFNYSGKMLFLPEIDFTLKARAWINCGRIIIRNVYFNKYGETINVYYMFY